MINTESINKIFYLCLYAKLESVSGVAEYALPFSTLEDARMVDEKLRALECQNFGKDSQIRVAVWDVVTLELSQSPQAPPNVLAI
ncbi:unnamed protein product [Coffea canephora]|uniref:Uncharacterized protein n=1 Tax=Coffea canephora TaxID=49390 RepID=A0A068V241_COFCA|nr:unnamed protein product [Coffea canephora]